MPADINYVDHLLRYAIEHPDKLDDMYYLKYIIRSWDYIIFYYIEHFRDVHAKLTYANLEAALDAAKLDWADPKSLLNTQAGGNKLTNEDVRSVTTASLDSPQDYAIVITKATLNRYKEIMLSPLLSDEDLQAMSIECRKVGQILFGSKLVEEITSLLDGSVPYLKLGKTKYRNIDCLSYITNKVAQYQNLLNPSRIQNYEDSIINAFADAPISRYPAYALNLGRGIMTDPQPGSVISLLAADKVGKTRFTIGENVLPTLLLGKNVLYLTGEMREDQILTCLLVKFLYIKGYMIEENLCSQILKCINSIRKGTDTEEDREFYINGPRKAIEAVILYEHELFHSGKYGKIVVRHISDNPGPIGINRYFVSEEWASLLEAELDAMKPEERYALVVQDHVNHIKSATGISPTQVVTDYLQRAKTIASNKKRPLVFLIINHLATEVIKALEEKGNLEGIKVRGHNSSEESKSCDAQWVLYIKPNQARDSLLTLAIKNDRFKDIVATYKTDEFTVLALRGYCQFSFFGEQKGEYPTSKEELDAFLDSRPT